MIINFKFYIFILLSIFVFNTNYAQQATISGIVLNETDGKPMQNAIISLDRDNKINTDNKGYFQFENVKIGSHQLYIDFLGYKIEKIDIEVTTENENIQLANIFLKSSEIQISEVVIYATQTNYNPKYQGSNITISSKEIKQIQPLGSEEILKRVPGINVSGDMGMSNRLNVGIRGSYPRRSVNLLLMEDGSPIAPAPYLAPEAYYNPPADRLDGIEIMKGADILAFGSNTMYGAINYITKKPPIKPTLGINLSGGSNQYHSEYITYGGTWDKVGAEIQVLNKNFGGFQDNSQSHIFNTTAKLYTELNTKSSLYVKLNYHQEKSKSTYSALTPYSFLTDAKQNPFDADDLFTRRYAVDLIYNYKITDKLILSTKLYANQFQRDWWRQENTVIKASTAAAYLGEDIYNDRYAYLIGETFGDNDYLRVGKIVNGRESTRARNRMFRVAGLSETIKYNYEKGNLIMNIEGNIKGHWETFNNIEFINDSSRFARSGKLDKDQFYKLGAYSAFVKNRIQVKNLIITPSLRYEFVRVDGFDRVAISKMTNNNGSKNFGGQKNTYNSFIPGLTVAYNLKEDNKLNVFAGVYKGYTAPIADNAFLTVDNGVVSTPTADQTINRKPETSINFEIGIKGLLFDQFANFQATYFNNHIKNYYSAGRNEAFQTLGAVNIQGLEMGLNLNLHQLYNNQNHKLTVNIGASITKGKILSGLLKDSDLLKAKHTDATKQELIDKINGERPGFDVYFASSTGQDSLISGQMALADFGKIKRLDFVFGKNGLTNNTAPYIPLYLLNFGFNYDYKGFGVGANINIVAKQYTDYLNFKNETAEGAIGQLNAFNTIDLNLSYSFETNKNKYLNGLRLFVTGKNISNRIYESSRLHRVSSGIMPAGFIQINGGANYTF
jgi:Fe(3+) dicitrate transport protein